MHKALLFLAIACGIPAFIAGQDLSTTVRDQLKDKTLLLRHPLLSNDQVFAADGSVPGATKEGPWTVYGCLRIENIILTQDRLTVEGKRVYYAYDPAQGALLPRQSQHLVRIQIPLAHALESLEEAKRIIGEVFALTKEDAVNDAPEFWKPYLAKKANLSPSALPGAKDSESPLADKGSPPGVNQAAQAQSKPGFLSESDIKNMKTKAPQPIFTPEPDRPELPDHLQVEGMVVLDAVVDSKGNVGAVHILQPLGLGFDENAVAAVKRWRFKPAIKDGHPVASSFNITVDFRRW